jgi:hypothetical protein
MRLALPLLLAVMVVALFTGTHAVPAQPATQPAAHPRAALRVGVYDTRAVCVAGRNSRAFASAIDDLRHQLKDAQAAHDTARAEQVKQRGATLQTVRHLQAFSNAPVDDILADIKPQLPAIAVETDVDLIVARCDFQSPDVELVDVTDQLVQAFHPDAQTLQAVAQVRKAKPMAMVDVLMHHD